MVLRFLRNPDEFLVDTVKKPRLRWQTLIVVLSGLAITIWRIALIPIWGPAAEPIAEPLIIISLAVMVIMVVIWMVLTYIWHFLARIFGGRSRYGRLLRTTGWGFIPIGVGGLLWSLGWTASLANVSTPPRPPQLGTGVSPSFVDYYQQYTLFIAQAEGDPILIVGLGLGTLVAVGAGYYWQRAVMIGGEVNRTVATVCAMLGVLVFTLWGVNPIF